MARSLPRRIAVAAIGIPTAFSLVLLGGWPLVAAIAVLAVLGVAEVFRLGVARGVRAVPISGFAGAAAAPIGMYLLGQGVGTAVWVGFAAIAWFLATMAEALWRRAPTAGPLGAIGVSVFAVLYASVLPSFLLLLRHSDAVTGRWAATWVVFLPLAVTWTCDTMAMAGGAALGGPKFSPTISPNKTWAGTVSGSLAAAAIAPVYGVLALAPAGVSLSWTKLVLLGLVLSIVGHLGDLVESLLKREAGVKDSGGAFPGHGGVLDRLDSLYWVLPTAVWLLSAYGTI